MKITARALAYGGEAVGTADNGMVCFVRGLLPGETAEVAITEEKKNFLRGRIRELLTFSPHRIPPACPHAGSCPGCVFQHCDHATELEWKQRQFEYFLRDFPGERRPLFPSPRRFGWRNRLKLKCAGGRYGYVGWDNTSFCPVETCLLATPEIREALANAPAPADGTLFFRSTSSWSGVVDENAPALLTEEVPGAGRFQVPATGFFQTNIPVAAELVSRVIEVLKARGVRSLLELFCGAGFFSLAAARVLPELRCSGVEAEKSAVEAARLNARQARLGERCHFQASDALKFPPGRFDACLLDPPRTGVRSPLLRRLLESGIPLLLYVSCGPDTLRRDLKILETRYQVTDAGALDMFPCTAHFETFTVLTLSNRPS